MYVKVLGALAIAFTTLVSAQTRQYEIQVSHNDELFIINGEKFVAKTYCFNMQKGDKVIFISGRPSGACVSAELLNLRTDRVCRVWCE
jgi:hypothetical protein